MFLFVGRGVALLRAEWGGWINVWHWAAGWSSRWGLRERLGLNDMISVLWQDGLKWCGHELRGTMIGRRNEWSVR